MQTARVLGSTRATIKHDSLKGERLLIVQPLGAHASADGPPLLAIDHLGARKGDQVMITSDGAHTKELLQHDRAPVRWSVIGLLDSPAN